MNRKLLLVIPPVLALPVVVLAAGLGSAFYGITPMAAGPLGAAGLERVVDGYTSVGLVDTGAGAWALVDAGDDATGTALLAALQAHGAGPDAVTAIFLTHAHPDHVSACSVFPNARTYLLEAELPYARGERAYHGPLPMLFGPQVAKCATFVIAKDGEPVTVGTRTLTPYAVPGHTAGSAAWLVGGVLFIGDSAAVKSGPELVGAPWVFSDDTGENVASVKALGARLAGSPPSVVVPAHSGTIDGAALVTFGR